jgi:hypothetical protein
MLNSFDDLMEALSAGDSIELERLYYENLQDDMVPDLVLAHLELMREAGETIPASALAIEALIKRNLALSKQKWP